jgi:hypothetical protein
MVLNTLFALDLLLMTSFKVFQYFNEGKRFITVKDFLTILDLQMVVYSRATWAVTPDTPLTQAFIFHHQPEGAAFWWGVCEGNFSARRPMHWALQLALGLLLWVALVLYAGAPFYAR